VRHVLTEPLPDPDVSVAVDHVHELPVVEPAADLAFCADHGRQLCRCGVPDVAAIFLPDLALSVIRWVYPTQLVFLERCLHDTRKSWNFRSHRRRRRRDCRCNSGRRHGLSWRLLLCCGPRKRFGFMLDRFVWRGDPCAGGTFGLHRVPDLVSDQAATLRGTRLIGAGREVDSLLEGERARAECLRRLPGGRIVMDSHVGEAVTCRSLERSTEVCWQRSTSPSDCLLKHVSVGFRTGGGRRRFRGIVTDRSDQIGLGGFELLRRGSIRLLRSRLGRGIRRFFRRPCG